MRLLGETRGRVDLDEVGEAQSPVLWCSMPARGCKHVALCVAPVSVRAQLVEGQAPRGDDGDIGALQKDVELLGKCLGMLSVVHVPVRHNIRRRLHDQVVPDLVQPGVGLVLDKREGRQRGN